MEAKIKETNPGILESYLLFFFFLMGKEKEKIYLSLNSSIFFIIKHILDFPLTGLNGGWHKKE